MIGAIVLAAGSSSRMGRAKAGLPVGASGITFLETILATLAAAGVADVRVVQAPGDEPPHPNAVVNPDPSAKMLSSVQCGLRAFDRELGAVLLWPVDHPLVKSESVLAILAAFGASNAPIVVPTYADRRGHPTLFASRVLAELLNADPAKGARAVVHGHTDRLELPVDDPGVVADIDTPEDYALAFGVRLPSLSELR